MTLAHALEPSAPKARPFLKWVGGKRQLLSALLKRAPTAWTTYHEPFLGGGALFFALRPKHAVLSDSNERLIKTYRAIRDDVEGVIDALKTYTRLYEHNAHACYYGARDIDVDSLSNAALAAWFIFMNKAGFNGLYRVNASNKFNVPMGRYTNPVICDDENLHACSAALQGAAILHADFRSVEHESKHTTRSGAFWYADPPYVPISATADFTSYTIDGFGPDDQLALRDVALGLKYRGVHVLLSNSSASGVYSLYGPAFKIEAVDARRSINSNSAKRGAVKEVIIT